MSNSLREDLAEYAHDAWREYMEYFLGKLRKAPGGGLYISPNYVRALRRQMSLDYAKLMPHEQNLDREQADRILDVILRSK